MKTVLKLNKKAMQHKMLDYDMSLKELSEKTGYSYSGVESWFRKRNNGCPRVDALAAIMDALNMELTELIIVEKVDDSEIQKLKLD